MAVTVAGMALQETRLAEQDGRTVRIAGKHGWQRYPVAEIGAVHGNITALRPDEGAGPVVPVLFDDKPELTGFYRVDGASSALTRYADGAVQHANWALSLTRIGSSPDVEIESRVPTVARQTDHSVTAVYWHAAAVDYSSYMTGPANPAGYVTRASADGDVVTHLGIPTTYAPRWTVNAADYLAGSSRLLLDGQRRLGTHTPPHSTWEINNGLVRVTPLAAGSNRLAVSCWDSGAWRSVDGFFFFTGSPAVEVSGTPSLAVLRNDPEEVLVRLSYPAGATGRMTVDLGLRRGSRFVTGVIKRSSAAHLYVSSLRSSSSVTGGLRSTTVDGDGNRIVLGSSKSVSTTPTAIYRGSQTQFDFFVGHEVGSSPQAGDAYAALLAQYVGSLGGAEDVVIRQ